MFLRLFRCFFLMFLFVLINSIFNFANSSEEDLPQFEQGIEYLEKLNIYPLHNKDIMGQGQNIVVIKDTPSPNHLVINKDITTNIYICAEGFEDKSQINLDSRKKMGEGTEHGNSVISLINGKRESKKLIFDFLPEDELFKRIPKYERLEKELTFYGGIAPKSKVFCINHLCQSIYGPKDHIDDLHKMIIKACEIGKIITSSSSFLCPKELNNNPFSDGKNGKLKSSIVEFIRTQLVKNDCVLILCTCNYGTALNKNKRTQYLEDLSEDPEISKRLLIVGNLQDINQEEGSLKVEINGSSSFAGTGFSNKNVVFTLGSNITCGSGMPCCLEGRPFDIDHQPLQTQSGSSLATPLVAGLFSLYLQHKGPEYSIVEAIQDFKSKTIPLKDKDMFGNGIISVEKLFSDLFSQENK